MRLWTDTTVIEATGGYAYGHQPHGFDVHTHPGRKVWSADRVAIDSRSISGGELFIAIQGERVDGHEYVREALEKGAAAAVVHYVPEGISQDAPLIVVENTGDALEALARYNRARSHARIVGVTGSVGKTSAKEALRLALSAHGETFASYGNFNNHIGTPLNLANLPPSAQFAVFEMGMNHSGEIAQLTRQVRPHVAMITNVEAVHLEFFDDVEGIAEAKSEIFEGITMDGVAVLNRDNAHFQRCMVHAQNQGINRIITFGRDAAADVRLISCTPTLAGSEVAVMVDGKGLQFTLAAIGAHWGMTAVCALACVRALDLDVTASAYALKEFSEPKGRGRLSSIAVPGGTATLIDDSYNASPAAMKAAFVKLADVKRAAGAPRAVAILGEMRELGETAPAMHAELAPVLVEKGIDIVFTACPLMEHLFNALPGEMRGAHAADAAALLPVVKAALKPGDMVLVKGSHGSKMYTLAEGLQ